MRGIFFKWKLQEKFHIESQTHGTPFRNWISYGKAPISMKWKSEFLTLLLSLNYVTAWNQCLSQNKIATDWTHFNIGDSEKPYTSSTHSGHILKIMTSWNLRTLELLQNRINKSSHFRSTWYTDKSNSMVAS